MNWNTFPRFCNSLKWCLSRGWRWVLSLVFTILGWFYLGRDKLREEQKLSQDMEQVRVRQDTSGIFLTRVYRLLLFGSVNGSIFNVPVQRCPELWACALCIFPALVYVLPKQAWACVLWILFLLTPDGVLANMLGPVGVDLYFVNCVKAGVIDWSN